MPISIQDIDAITTQKEVEVAIKEMARGAKVEVKPLKQVAGRQTAMILVDEKTAKIIIKEGHIKIGWTSCRAKENSI